MKREAYFKTCIILLAGLTASAGYGQPSWEGPDQYVVLSTSDNSVNYSSPDAYYTINKTFGSFEGKSVAVGVAPMFRVFQKDMSVFTEELKLHLQLSQQYKVPIFICLSTFVFNIARPDMWNWWDGTMPGYDPKNRYNVEWTDWTADSAVKIGWLNWGSQMRLPPMPNLMSPDFRKELKVAFITLGSIVKQWYNALPEDEKWLLIGFRSTDEVAIGVNNWYYPNGNSYLDKDPKDDPQTGLQPLELPSRGVQTIGYAAVKTAGIKKSGIITIEDINEVCQIHCSYSSKVLYDLGFPREMIYSSSFGKTEGECKTCLTKYSCPSWSFYHANAITPTKFTAAFDALEHSDAPHWAMAEWGIARDASTDQYHTGLTRSLGLSGCRFVRITGEHFRPPDQGIAPELAEALQLITEQ
jgi:hypothetical protein